ncbi:MAG TPA: PEGA domain-containing protein [Polyangiaceae bacterium]|nr:PEGA domain-containing protein [Polyangiaceae bacterium]
MSRPANPTEPPNRNLRAPTVVSLPVRDGMRTIDLPLNQGPSSSYEGLESLARVDELSVVEDEPSDDSTSELSVVFRAAHHSERAPHSGPQYQERAPYSDRPHHSDRPPYQDPGAQYAMFGDAAPASGPLDPGAIHARSVVPGPSVNPTGRPITLPPNVIMTRPPPPPGKHSSAPPPAHAVDLPTLPEPPIVPGELRARADSIVDFDDDVDTTVMQPRWDSPSDRPPVDSLQPMALPSLPPPPVPVLPADYAGFTGSAAPARSALPPPTSSYVARAGNPLQVTAPRLAAPRVMPRSQAGGGSRNWYSLLAAGGIALGIAAAIAVYAAQRNRGELVIDVADQTCGAVDDVKVFVDDELACNSSPCSVRVSNGSHVVRAEAAGYAIAAPQAVLVDPNTPTLHKVQFGATTKTGLEVRSKAAGLILYLDGKQIGELPKRVTGLSSGEHTVLVTGGEGYYAEERKIDLKPDEILVIDELALKPRTASLHIPASEQLSGATVLIDGAQVRLPFDKELDSSRRYHVQARRAGYDDFDAWVDFSSGDRDKSLNILLMPKQGNAEMPRADEPPPERAMAANFASEAPRRSSGRGARNASSAEATGQSRLNLLSDPPAMVLLDGKPIGQTPRMGLKVEPGPHSVLFIHPTLGRARASAKLEPGQSKTLRARF